MRARSREDGSAEADFGNLRSVFPVLHLPSFHWVLFRQEEQKILIELPIPSLPMTDMIAL